jgi:cobalt-zinc-cadmium efflux system outer membrane protein
LEARAVAQRADLAADKQELMAQAHKLGLARYEAIFQQNEIGAHYEREPTGGDYSIGPSLVIPIPIFNLGQAASARAQARFRQAEQRYLALTVEIQSEVRAALDRMRLARERVEYYQSTALPLRRRIVEETQLQYTAMQIGVFDLLRAKQEEVNQGREYVESLRDYWTARAQLEKAVGGSLSGKTFQLGKNTIGER